MLYMNKFDNSYSFFFLKLSLLLIFLKSLHAWFTWDFNVIIVNFIGVALFVFIAIKYAYAFKITKGNLLLSILFFITQLYIVKTGNLNALIGAIISGILISFLLFLNDKYKINILNFITKAFAGLLTVSLIAWIFYLLGFSLPSFNATYNDGQYDFQNHYFYLVNNKVMLIDFIRRFSSVFLEPGHLGMITAFLLYVYKFNFKKNEVIIIFIATIFTFSLAAYIIVVFSILAIALTNSKKPFLYFFSLIIAVFLFYLFFKDYNNGDNVINTFIIERLKYEDGTISGNNRFTSYLEDYYNRFITTDDKYIGIGSEYNKIDWGGGNAGYKLFIIQQGFIGLFLVFVFYWGVTLKYKSKDAYFLLIVFILSFIQASYALWECELIIFITGLSLFRNKKSAIPMIKKI